MVIEDALINNVKTAVSKYGIEGIDLNTIAKIANVNMKDAYRCFSSKEALLLKAYIRENGAIFKSILDDLDNNHGIDLTFRQKVKKNFNVTWKTLLSDTERLFFCVTYYHSHLFKVALEYHKTQLKELTNRLGNFFFSKEDCEQTMYALCSILYDSSFAVVTGRVENSEGYEKRVFETAYSIMQSQMKKPL